MTPAQQTRKDRADQYLATVRHIVGPLLLSPAPLSEDRCAATDLMMLTARDMRIAVRIRTEARARQYPGDFTVRAALPSGTPTEFSKIMAGFADWLFYGIGVTGSRAVYPWYVLDLDVFRACVGRDGPERYGLLKRNPCDQVAFWAFQIAKFPRALIVSRSQTKEMR